MQEKRRNIRFLVTDIDITFKGIHDRKVRIRDISTEGVSVESEGRLEIGRKYHLNIEYDHKSVSFKGMVIWSRLCRSIKNPEEEIMPIYQVGIEFINTSSEEMADIKNSIECHLIAGRASKTNEDFIGSLKPEIRQDCLLYYGEKI
jgi:hypothetical protein